MLQMQTITWLGLMPCHGTPETAQEWAIVIAFNLMVAGFVGFKVPHAPSQKVGLASWTAGALLFVAVFGHALLTRG